MFVAGIDILHPLDQDRNGVVVVCQARLDREVQRRVTEVIGDVVHAIDSFEDRRVASRQCLHQHVGTLETPFVLEKETKDECHAPDRKDAGGGGTKSMS